MKQKTIITLFITMLGSGEIIAVQNGKVLFESKCESCHLTTRPTAEQFKNLTAPAIMGVMRHVKQTYPDKKEVVEFIVDYSYNPTLERAICMSGKIERFVLMPSQKENVTKEELGLIAEYLYDNFPPANFKGMSRENRF